MMDPVKAGTTSKPLAPGSKRKPAVASVHTQEYSTSCKIGPSSSSLQPVAIKQESVQYEACHQNLMSWSTLTLSQDVGKVVSLALLPRIHPVQSLTIDARDTRVIPLLNFQLPGSVGGHITYTLEAHVRGILFFQPSKTFCY